MELTDEEREAIDQEVATILVKIKESGWTETMKIITAFQAGVEFWKKRMDEPMQQLPNLRKPKQK